MRVVLGRLMLAAAIGLGAIHAVRGADERAGDEAAFRVMTFNIRFDNPADGENAWPRRRDWVAEIIREQRTDIAGLQEALRRQIDDLQERLPGYEWYGVGRDDGRDRGEYVPIFYRKERFELVDKGTFWLSPTPDEPGSRGWDAQLPRTTTWLRLKDRTTGRTLTAFNTHFDHRGAQARDESARLLLVKVREIAGEDPVVLTGDFNTVPTTEPYRILTGTTRRAGGNEADAAPPVVPLRDAERISSARPEGPNSTWNGFREIVPQMKIDYIFTLGFDVRSHRIIDERREGRFPSDHLPVAATLSYSAAQKD